MIRSFRRHLLDRFVLRPTRHPIGYAPKERILLTVDQITDEYFVERRSGLPELSSNETRNESAQRKLRPDLLILKFPGTAGRAERASSWPCEFLPKLNVKLCSWNAPGYGASSGRASLSAIPARALRFWSLVTQEYQGMMPPVWLIGNSLGCATATYLASRPDINVQGLVLRNPPPLIPTIKRVARQYPLGHLTDGIAESLPPEMNLAITAHEARVPTVMLQSEQDQLVPPELQMQVFDSLPGPKRLVVMKGLGHDGVATESHEGEIGEAIDWLSGQRGADAGG